MPPVSPISFTTPDSTYRSGVRAIRRLASALALYGIPITLVLLAAVWFGLRITRDVDPPIATTTSTAMRPDIGPGGLVFLRSADADDLAPGTAVAYRDDEDDITFGRISSVNPDGTLVIAQDNREDDEPAIVASDDVIGTIGTRLPLLGYWLVLLRATAGQVLLAAVCFFGFAGALRDRFHDRARPSAAEPVPDEPHPVPYGGAMSITPAELRHVRFAQVRRGYDTEAVDRALESVADSIEELLHERHELIERARHLESDIERYREVEGTLTETLALAERAAEELKAEAQADADRSLADARAQLAAAQQAAAAATAAASDAPAAVVATPAATSTLPDPAFIELLGETRAIRSLLQALLTASPPGEGGSPFTPRH
jgi:signal peptidase I